MRTLLLAITTAGCLSKARLSDFPDSSDAIPFEEVRHKQYDDGDLSWTRDFANGKDYHVILRPQGEQETIHSIQQALDSFGYRVMRIDSAENIVVGQRGMRAHEWKSICAVYYAFNPNDVQIYIMN